jgi:hypothetical protein
MQHYLREWRWGAKAFIGSAFFLFAAGWAPVPGPEPAWVGALLFLTRLGAPGWLAFLLLAAAAFAAVITCAELMRAAYRRFVPATCPTCGGPAYGEGREPVLYVCRHCGHRHDTGIRESQTD